MSTAAVKTLTVAQALIKRLEEHGVVQAFGIPGTHNLPLFEALANSSSIRHTATRHEQGAGYAADAFARSGGGIAPCFVTTGPGVTNITTAIATAFADSVPMMVVATSPPAWADRNDTGSLHECKNQFAAIAALSGSAEQVRSASQAVAGIDRVMASFASGRPRPAYIEIPLDVLTEAESIDPPPITTSPRVTPDRERVRAAARMLREASSCGMIVGGGAADAGSVVTSLAERLAAGVVSSVNGKGVVPEDHACSLGASLRLEPAQRFLCECDVVLAVGTELAESDLWRDPPLPLSGRLIRLDIASTQLALNATADIELEGDAEATLRLINAELEDFPAPSGRIGRLAPARAAIEDSAAESGGEFRGLMRTLSEVLPANAILANDSARLCYFGAAHFYPAKASRRFLYPTGFATLGYAVPAALGAKLAHPDRTVIGLSGDGGLLFSVAELNAAAEARVSLPILVHSDGGYGAIRDEMVAEAMPRVGVDFDPGTLSQIAGGLGGRGARVSNAEGLAEALDGAMNFNGPTVIEIPDVALQAWA